MKLKLPACRPAVPAGQGHRQPSSAEMSDGNSCSTPLQARPPDLREHACCLPCTGLATGPDDGSRLPRSGIHRAEREQSGFPHDVIERQLAHKETDAGQGCVQPG
jgi:hypothetical protein